VIADSRIGDLLSQANGLTTTTLVLCRTRHTVHAARRWVAEHGAVTGVDITTPRGLATQAYELPPGQVVQAPVPELPHGSDIAKRIGGRPGLSMVALRHVTAARLAREAGHSLDALPDWLMDLERSGWGADSDQAAIAWLVRRCVEAGPKLSVAHQYDEVRFLGYDVDPALVQPWERAVVEALGGHIGADLPSMRELPCVHVPGATEEARAVVAHVLPEPMDAVVLYTHEATGRRVVAALERNGCAASWLGGLSVASHPLSRAMVAAGSWFEGERDPPISAGDLTLILSLAGVRFRPPEHAQTWLRGRLGAEPAAVSPSDTIRAMSSTGLLHAPLTRWLAALDALGSPAALAILARLRVLSACIRSVSLEDEFDVVAPQPWLDDFEAAILDLLGEIPDSASPPAPGTVGALRRFLLVFRIADPDDMVCLTLLGQLRDRAAWPVRPALIRQLAAGELDDRKVRGGVSVMPLSAWDGRPADRLVVVDAHDKGLGRAPSPDPLLTPSELAALGQPSGRQAVELHTALVVQACTASKLPLVVVAERDASGRHVVPPFGLALVADPSASPLASLPEDSAGVASASGVAPSGAPSGGALQQFLSAQATAEWIRAGQASLPVAAEGSPRFLATLHERLHYAPVVPEWVSHLLGDASLEPHAALGAGPHSVSNLFEPMSRCMYRAFARVVLGVRPAEELSEDLDPKFLGTAVHQALERALVDIDLRPQNQVDERRAAAVSALRRETDRALADVARDLPGLSSARTAATRGLGERWNAHWTAWAEGRISRSDPHQKNALFESLKRHPALDGAVYRLRQLGPSETSVSDLELSWWLERAASEAAHQDLRLWSVDRLRRLRRDPFPESWDEALRQIVGHPRFMELLSARQQLLDNVKILARSQGAHSAEVGFGAGSEPAAVMARGDVVGSVDIGDITLALGGELVAVRGQIDHVRAYDGYSERRLEVLDYKTGRAPPMKSMLDDVASLRLPQLWIYALVLKAAQEAGRLPGAFDAPVGALGYDHVSHVVSDGSHNRRDGRRRSLVVESRQIERVAGWLGRLVAKARTGQWPLKPQTRSCPVVDRGAWCDYAGACRLRGVSR
jgi:RecB family exonuclease